MPGEVEALGQAIVAAREAILTPVGRVTAGILGATPGPLADQAIPHLEAATHPLRATTDPPLQLTGLTSLSLPTELLITPTIHHMDTLCLCTSILEQLWV